MAPKLASCAPDSSQILGLARTLDQTILGRWYGWGFRGQEVPQDCQQPRHAAGEHKDIMPAHGRQELRDAVDDESRAQENGTAIDPLGLLDFFTGKKVGT